MKHSILTLAATAALLTGAAGSAHAAETCYTMPVPAVPAVYDTITTPAVTVTEYEFTHAQDGNGQGNGQGPVNKWQDDPNWNAETNPQSVGWTATGNTRVRVVEVEKITTVLVSAEIPAGTVEECIDLPDGTPPAPVGAPEAPLGNLDPVPAEIPAPAAEAPGVPLAVVGYPAPAVTPVASRGVNLDTGATATELPAELASTGAADWALPAGAGLLALGVATVIFARRFNTTN